MTLRQNKQLLARKTFALIALIAVSAFALLFTPLRSALTGVLYSVAPSVWRAGGNAESVLGAFLTNFKEKNALVNENETLSEAISIMETKVLDRNLLAEKVTKLEEAFGRVRLDDRVVANVLVGPSRSPYDTLVIDVGALEGISSGDMVVYAGSGVIGEITDVNPRSSIVKLFSSPGEENFVIVGPHYIPVTALGRGMGNFESKVPQDSLITVGDKVLTQKNSLIIGEISTVESKPAEPFKRIFFRVSFNINEIQSVEVIITKRL